MSGKTLCIGLFAAATALTCLSSVASAGQVYLYPKAGPQGEPVRITSDVPDVAQLTSEPVMAILIDRGGWIICAEPNYMGDCVFSMPGYLRNMQSTPIGPRAQSLRNAGLVHDYRWSAKSSFKVSPSIDNRHSLALGGPDQQVVEIGGDVADLNAVGVTFPIMAVRVGDRRFGWQLCSERNYAGHCIFMVDGITDFPAIFGWNVASVRGVSSGATSTRDQLREKLAASGK